MPRMIRFTQKSGEEVWVAPARVAAVRLAHRDKDVTLIRFSGAEDDYVAVRESPVEVARKVDHELSA